MSERFYIGRKQIITTVRPEPKTEEEKVLNTLSDIVVREVPIDEWENAMADFGVLQ